MTWFKRFVCWLRGHDPVRGPGEVCEVELTCHHIDGTTSSRVVPARVHPVTCSRCTEMLRGEVVFLLNIKFEAS